MSHTPHMLAEEFPDLVDKMSALKASDAHFAKLYDEYHEVNQAVYLAETNVTPMDQFAEENLRKSRAALKDALYELMVTAA